MRKSYTRKKSKLVLGVGINDANYTICQVIDGQRKTCPYYERWTHMLSRCYSKRYLDRYPTYVGCSVCSEWLRFSNFKSWMMTKDWKKKDLDKDIIKDGNKIYTPELCCFISQNTNKLLNDHGRARGEHPKGVTWCERDSTFRAHVRVSGRLKFIGNFNNASSASNAYIEEKSKIIISTANSEPDERVKRGLINYAEKMRERIDSCV